ncbi:MAG: sulfite exporter TauE/SafE family protein, partial [Anaerolineae bacterium]|nr:sulfite exporter TauE/SafE family protein [Anaerolineae bacterium]
MEGTFDWATRGFVDLRLTVLILAGSLIGVQVGALGTSYVKEYMIKVVAAVIMLLASVSRAVMIPAYLSDLRVIPMGDTTYDLVSNVSRV